ncbi:MAG: Mur ligase domain-containing protein [Christensenellales bacterium]
MNLEQLTEGMPELVEITGNAQTVIGTLTADSRAKCDAGLFFCIRGGKVDAHDFAPQAVANGCCALVVERKLEIDCPQVVVTDVRAAMTRIASAFNGHPERRMKLVGVTGTKARRPRPICSRASWRARACAAALSARPAASRERRSCPAI